MPEIAAWQDAALPFTVDYARPALERVRQRAAEGMIALPRVGMGVGGLLLGDRTPAGIRITGTLELPCSHTLGPTFQLTPDEIREGLELVKSVTAPRSVVGIYCTRTRGSVTLGNTDKDLFDLLCPEPWQVLFVLRPAPGEATRAAVFFRRLGEIFQGTVKELWEWRQAEVEQDPEALPARPEPPSRIVSPPAAPAVIPMPAPAVSAPATSGDHASTPTVIQMPRAVAPPRPEPPVSRPAPVAAPMSSWSPSPPEATPLSPSLPAPPLPPPGR